MVETVHAQWKIAKIDEKQRRTVKFSMSSKKSISTESISSDRFATGSRINALTAHAQTLLSCLKQVALDRLRVRLNVILLTQRLLQKLRLLTAIPHCLAVRYRRMVHPAVQLISCLDQYFDVAIRF